MIIYINDKEYELKEDVLNYLYLGEGEEGIAYI